MKVLRRGISPKPRDGCIWNGIASLIKATEEKQKEKLGQFGGIGHEYKSLSSFQPCGLVYSPQSSA